MKWPLASTGLKPCDGLDIDAIGPHTITLRTERSKEGEWGKRATWLKCDAFLLLLLLPVVVSIYHVLQQQQQAVHLRHLIRLLLSCPLHSLLLSCFDPRNLSLHWHPSSPLVPAHSHHMPSLLLFCLFACLHTPSLVSVLFPGLCKCVCVCVCVCVLALSMTTAASAVNCRINCDYRTATELWNMNLRECKLAPLAFSVILTLAALPLLSACHLHWLQLLTFPYFTALCFSIIIICLHYRWRYCVREESVWAKSIRQLLFSVHRTALICSRVSFQVLSEKVCVCVCCWPIAHFGLLDWLLFPFYLLLPSFADRIINLTIELIGEIKWASRNCCWEWVWAKKWVSACALAFFACCLIFYLALYSLRCCCCWSVCTTRAHTKAAIICSLFAPISIFHY